MRFSFEGVRAASGKPVNGTLEARSADDALDELKGRGIVVQPDRLIESVPVPGKPSLLARFATALEEAPDEGVRFPWRWRLCGAGIGAVIIAAGVGVAIAGRSGAAGTVEVIGAVVASIGALVTFWSLVGRFGGKGPGNDAA